MKEREKELKKTRLQKELDAVHDSYKSQMQILQSQNEALNNYISDLRREIEILKSHRDTLIHGQVLFRTQVLSLQKNGEKVSHELAIPVLSAWNEAK